MSNSYISTKKVALVITILVLVIGSIAYFATSVAERNNEMMYKAAYGENATLPNNYLDL